MTATAPTSACAEAVRKGCAFLLSKQQADGHFSDPQMPALTALPLWALSCAPLDKSNKQAIQTLQQSKAKAAKFVLATQREDGGFYVPKPGRGGSE